MAMVMRMMMMVMRVILMTTLDDTRVIDMCIIFFLYKCNDSNGGDSDNSNDKKDSDDDDDNDNEDYVDEHGTWVEVDTTITATVCATGRSRPIKQLLHSLHLYISVHSHLRKAKFEKSASPKYKDYDRFSNKAVYLPSKKGFSLVNSQINCIEPETLTNFANTVESRRSV